MSQILTNIEGILKDKYQPALANLINIEPAPFLEMIRKEPLQNNYVDIKISNKTVVLGSSNTGAMINALDTEIQGSYAAAKWNLARSLFGDGSGKLANCQATSANTNTVEVDDTARLIEGLLIDIYPTGSTAPTETRRRIVHVDHENKTVTVDGTPFQVTAGYLTVQGSLDREITGLGAIFGSGDTLYGVSRTANPWLNPQTVSLDGNITDMGLYRGIRRAAKFRGAKIDLLMMGDRAFEAYQTYMDNHTTHLLEKHKFMGGATGYSILVGDREVIIVNESMVPENEVWGVDTKSFVLQQTPWEFLSHRGSIFTLQANTSIYRALLASYGNLICSNPGGCVKFTDCAPEEAA